MSGMIHPLAWQRQTELLNWMNPGQAGSDRRKDRAGYTEDLSAGLWLMPQATAAIRNPCPGAQTGRLLIYTICPLIEART